MKVRYRPWTVAFTCVSLLAGWQAADAQSLTTGRPTLRLQDGSSGLLGGSRTDLSIDADEGQGLRVRRERFEFGGTSEGGLDGAAGDIGTVGAFAPGGAFDTGSGRGLTTTNLFGGASGARLDSYRLTWRYTLIDRPSWTARVGITGLSSESRWLNRAGGLRGLQPDASISPMLHASGAWRPTERFSLVAEFDGAGLTDRRIWDLGLSANYQISENWHAGIGYRLLDTGAEARIWPSLGRFSGATLSVGYRF